MNESKEELKTKISKIFTGIRNAINDREDEILSEVDNLYNELFVQEDLIKKCEKLPSKIKLSLEKGKLIDKEWNSDKYKLNSKINDCINMENNIKNIIEINKSFNQCYSNKININFSSENDNDIKELMKILEKYKKMI